MKKPFTVNTRNPDRLRRKLVQAMAAAGLLLPGFRGAEAMSRAPTPPDTNPFSLGVASGDPSSDSIVLWTRLAPDPLHGGGMPDQPVDVNWVVARDPDLQEILQQGTVTAQPTAAHSVHVTVKDLAPATHYYYGFSWGAAHSRLGRTRTLPDTKSTLDNLSFAFCSCQEYEFGWFTAYRHMAEETLDFVIHLGDYIYEEEHINPRLGAVREHNSGELSSLTDYRNRHALYRLDPDLQAAHAAFPFIHMWDDHEVDNDWAGFTPSDPDLQTEADFAARKALAAQAFYEHLALPASAQPRDGAMDLYRHFDLGSLARINLLDTRQHRSDQPCGTTVRRNPPVQFDCSERQDATATMTGAEQEEWLKQQLTSSPCHWNVIAQPGWFSQLVYPDTDGRARYHMDAWDGYPVQRQRLLDFLASAQPGNVVMLAGDWHINGVMDVKADYDNPRSATLGAEFGGTSISSVGPWAPNTIAAMPANPHVRYIDGDHLASGRNVHGYARCEVTVEQWRCDFRVLDSVKDPDSGISTAASFAVKNGVPGVSSSKVAPL